MFTIELTEEHLNVIQAGLNELPAKFSLPVLHAVGVQIKEQQEKQQKESPAGTQDA